MKVWVKISCLDCNKLGVYSSEEKARADNLGYCATTREVEVDGETVDQGKWD